MKARIRQRLALLVLFIVTALPGMAYGGVPEVSHVMVTDVTTRSFSVIWAASEASTAGLEVYDDQDGTVVAAGAVITPHPIGSGDEAIKTAAEDNGVMKVMVTGLEPDTAYYFMTITTSKSSPDTTYDPNAAPFTPVVTESETVRTYESGEDVLPFSNDLIIEPCYLDDGETFAEGTLLLATLEGGSYPVTAFVGDGVDLPNAVIDLNNVFSREAHENLDLSQGENLTLLNFRGLADNSIIPFSIITHEVPVDESLSEVKPAEFALKVGWNMVSFQLEPNVTDIETVLDPIMEKVSVIWGYDAENDLWLRYDKYGPSFLNDLTDLYCAKGYWLVMEQAASLKVYGDFCMDLDPTPLFAGWNLVGGRSIETVEVIFAMNDVWDNLNAVWYYDTGAEAWLRYDKFGPSFLNDLENIEPGDGYWFYMSGDDVW